LGSERRVIVRGRIRQELPFALVTMSTALLLPTLQPEVAFAGGAKAAAFCVALSLHRPRRGLLRFAASLLLGGALCHLGWALVHLPYSARNMSWLLDPSATTLSFLPLGVMLLSPARAAFAALPLALLVARLGCVAGPCCYASLAEAVPELLGWLVLHQALRRWPTHSAGVLLAGFGVVRLLAEPLHLPAGEPLLIEHWQVSATWVWVGLLIGPHLDGLERKGAR